MFGNNGIQNTGYLAGVLQVETVQRYFIDENIN